MKRMTRQRQAILDCFKQAAGPLAIEEILELASATVPHLNQATVYRNLKILIEEEMITAVEVPGMNTRYESMGLKHHHHFLCQACNRLFDVSGCPEGIAALVPKGFRLTGHAITLSGYCAACPEVQIR